MPKTKAKKKPAKKPTKTAKAKRPNGRPPKPVALVVAQQEELLERHSNGETLTAICRSMGIAKNSPWRWEDADPSRAGGFGDRYARARRFHAHAAASEVIDIADGIDERAEDHARAILGAVEEAEEKDKEHVARALAMAAIQRDRLRADSRKWYTGRTLPRIYGDHLTLSLSDEELDKMSDEQLRALAAGKVPKGVTG